MQKPPLHGYRTLFTFSIAHIRHIALAHATVFLRGIKIEANIVAVVLPFASSAHLRPRDARTCTQCSIPSRSSETADEYRAEGERGWRGGGLARICVYAKLWREMKRASYRARGESSSAKVENRHGSLGNKMRAPALPWGWGPLDNPYCTPHPLVLSLSPSRSSLAPPPLAVYTPIGRKSFVRARRAREKSHQIYLRANRMFEISQK